MSLSPYPREMSQATMMAGSSRWQSAVIGGNGAWRARMRTMNPKSNRTCLYRRSDRGPVLSLLGRSSVVTLSTWWRHQTETFSALLSLCAGNSPVTGEFPIQRPVTRSFDVFFDLRLNKRLSNQSWGWWFETPSHPVWRHCNASNTGILFSFTKHFVLKLAREPGNKTYGQVVMKGCFIIERNRTNVNIEMSCRCDIMNMSLSRCICVLCAWWYLIPSKSKFNEGYVTALGWCQRIHVCYRPALIILQT